MPNDNLAAPLPSGSAERRISSPLTRWMKDQLTCMDTGSLDERARTTVLDSIYENVSAHPPSHSMMTAGTLPPQEMLQKEGDALLERMQTQESRAGMKKAFDSAGTIFRNCPKCGYNWCDGGKNCRARPRRHTIDDLLGIADVPDEVFEDLLRKRTMDAMDHGQVSPEPIEVPHSLCLRCELVEFFHDQGIRGARMERLISGVLERVRRVSARLPLK